MGAKNSKIKNDLDKISISSVYEKPLSFLDKNNISQNNSSREDIINELKEEIILPIENESTESPEIIFEQKEQMKIKNYFENDNIENDIYNEDSNDYLNKFFPDDLFNKKRSKTFVPKPFILEAPRLPSKILENNILMSPFKLSMKSFGIIPKTNQEPNKILLDFQKDIIDCKSCNDNEEEMFEEYLLFNAETEKTTPNPEDLQSLLDCRKKMIKFRNSIEYKHCNEYENILNCGKIINEIQEEKETHHKKKSIWYKYIKDQLNKEKNKNYEHNKRLYSEPFYDVDINCDNFEDKKEEKKDQDEEEDGLFILGIIEKAAMERKRNKSVVVKSK